MNVTFYDIVVNGLNNPDCAFFVGQTFGYVLATRLVVMVGVIYFGFKLLDKIVFTWIPGSYNNWKAKHELNKVMDHLDKTL